jgi:hypothetical protein
MKHIISMKRIGSIFLGLSLAIGTAALLGQTPRQKEPPEPEMGKGDKTKNKKSEQKSEHKQDKTKGKQTSDKRKAEQPKAQ